MWDHVGVERTGQGLSEAAAFIEALPDDNTIDGRNAKRLASLIVAAALERRESRGGHYRLDHPEPDPAQAARTIVMPQTAALERVPAGVT